MKANTCDLNILPRSTAASSGSLMNADFSLASLLLAESQFQDLREYMSLAQEFVVRKQRDFHKRVDDHIAVNALEGEDRDEYYSSHEDDHDQLHSRFPRIVFSSTLLMACALFESSFVDLCKGFERALPTPIPWSHVKDKGITRAAAFLKENYGICLPNYSHWDRVINYFKVRDCIVHADGDLSNMQPEQANRIRRTVKLYGSLGLLVTNRHLVIGQEFVSAVIDDLGGIWPLLETACIQNEVVGPHYWP
jgi:hypothetical protein